MSEFLQLLAVYYLCDAAAALRPMTSDEVMGCMNTWEAVKTRFAPTFELAPRGSPERVAQMQAAYLAFLDWEAENADLVAEMQEQARAEVAGLTASAL